MDSPYPGGSAYVDSSMKDSQRLGDPPAPFGGTPLNDRNYDQQSSGNYSVPQPPYGNYQSASYPQQGPYSVAPSPGDVDNLKNFKFSPEELRVMNECRSESFMYRCIPFMTGLSVLTHFGVKRGYLRAHPKYGSFLKVLGASLAGFVFGKISYYKQCEQKILRQIPNSKLAEALRRREAGQKAFPNWQQQPADSGTPSYQGSVQTSAPARYEVPVQLDPKSIEASSAFNTDDYVSSLDIDSEKNRFSDGVSDVDQPSIMDLDMERNRNDGDSVVPLPRTNYDELRRQHRDSYLRPPANSRQDSPRPFSG